VPPGEDVAAFNWRLVRSYTPWIIRLGAVADSVVMRLGLLLLEAGAAKVRASGWGADYGRMAIFSKEGSTHG